MILYSLTHRRSGLNKVPNQRLNLPFINNRVRISIYRRVLSTLIRDPIA